MTRRLTRRALPSLVGARHRRQCGVPVCVAAVWRRGRPRPVRSGSSLAGFVTGLRPSRPCRGFPCRPGVGNPFRR